MSPFEAIFNRKPSMGVTELGIPDESLCNILTEEDLDQIIEEINHPEKQGVHNVPNDNLNYPDESGSFQHISAIVLNEFDPYLEEISYPPPPNTQVYDESNLFPPIYQPDQCSKFPPTESEAPTIQFTEPIPQVTSIVSNECVECGLETSKVHSCPDCLRFIHVPCGIQLGEEGYGSSILCKSVV